MSETPENKQVAPDGLLEFFQSRTDGLKEGARRSYRNALASWTAFAVGREDVAPDRAMLADWLAALYMRGFSYKTALHYLNIISGLYTAAVKEGFLHGDLPFKNFKELVVAVGEVRWDGGVKAQNLEEILKLTKAAATRNGVDAVAADILLLSLLNGGKPLREIITLRVEDTEGYATESLDVVRRNAASRRKYVFDLHQSEHTPKQLDRQVSERLLRLLRPSLPASATTVDDLLAGYWAYATLRCGATPRETVAALGGAPASMPVLELIGEIGGIGGIGAIGGETDGGDRQGISEERKGELRRSVARMVSVNPYGWFAMRLRPRVKFDEIQDRLELVEKEVGKPELFYPCEEIARRTGKKLVFRQRPVISDVVFFRSRVTEILPLFAKIGDLAWCYTTNGRPGAPYAMIPQATFNRFQTAIGQFTPDYEVAPVGGLTPGEGDRVEVIGGLFNGQELDLKKVDGRDAAHSIYRLHFDSANGIEWRVSLDNRQIRRAQSASANA